MLIEEALKALIESVVLEVTGRTQPGFIEQDSILPAISYLKVSEGTSYTQQGPSNLLKPMFQIDIWDKSFKQAVTLAKKLRKGISGYNGTVEGIEIKGIFLRNNSGVYEDAPELWRNRTLIELWYKED